MKTPFRQVLAQLLLVASATLLSNFAFAASPDPDPTPDPDQGSNPFQRGPNPTISFLEASRGDLSVRTSNVSSLVSGFGGGTIHYPTGTTGTMAGIVVSPGYLSGEGSIEWWGPKLASYGFVVLTIGTNTGFDQPASRARQINNALDYLISQNTSRTSPVRGMIDTNRLGVMGWSMGGGGTIRVASEGRVKAAIPLAPWDTITTYARNAKAPTLVFACQLDIIAPVSSHASPLYNALPSNINKAFVELNNGNHWCANGDNSYNAVLGRLGVSWMKRHLDNDLRYSQFLCGPNHTGDRNISSYRGNCPY